MEEKKKQNEITGLVYIPTRGEERKMTSEVPSFTGFPQTMLSVGQSDTDAELVRYHCFVYVCSLIQMIRSSHLQGSAIVVPVMDIRFKIHYSQCLLGRCAILSIFIVCLNE